MLDVSESRIPVLTLLRAHARQVLDPHEAAMVHETIRFVETHPDCAERFLSQGHLTGSAWIVDPPRRRALLTHHRKLDKWLQLGGHADGELDLLEVALREAREESGLASVRVVSPSLFDVDRHAIPARGSEPEHWHYDCRFLLEAEPDAPLVLSDESHELAWVDLDRIGDYTRQESILRMVRKTLGLR